VDLAANRALCRACSELFPLPALLAPAVDALAPLDPDHRPTDLRWTEHLDARAARFALAPSRAAAIPLLAFAAIWDGFLVVFYTALASSPKTPIFAFLFPLLHVGAGAFITWQGLTTLLNTTRIAIDTERLTVGAGPVPARSARLETRSIERFDVTTTRGRRGGTSSTVRALTRDGLAVKLPLPLSSEEHARFVAARLTAVLGSIREPTGYRDS
jgi:hypothetical protein